jgi:serine/threonine protein kinase
MHLGITYLPVHRTYTLLGTTEYLAPETIEGKGYGAAADWWALGILVFEMAVGFPPFYGKNPFTVYKKILECKPAFPAWMPSPSKGLISGFLTVNRTKRLGCGFALGL